MAFIFIYLPNMEQSVYLKILQALINVTALLYHCFMITLGINLIFQDERYLNLAGMAILAYDIYTILIQYYENTTNTTDSEPQE